MCKKRLVEDPPSKEKAAPCKLRTGHMFQEMASAWMESSPSSDPDELCGPQPGIGPLYSLASFPAKQQGVPGPPRPGVPAQGSAGKNRGGWVETLRVCRLGELSTHCSQRRRPRGCQGSGGSSIPTPLA